MYVLHFLILKLLMAYSFKTKIFIAYFLYTDFELYIKFNVKITLEKIFVLWIILRSWGHFGPKSADRSSFIWERIITKQSFRCLSTKALSDFQTGISPMKQRIIVITFLEKISNEFGRDIAGVFSALRLVSRLCICLLKWILTSDPVRSY